MLNFLVVVVLVDGLVTRQLRHFHLLLVVAETAQAVRNSHCGPIRFSRWRLLIESLFVMSVNDFVIPAILQINVLLLNAHVKLQIGI